MILITGCAGYIGSQISFVLKKHNYKFIGVDNLSYSYKKNFKYEKFFYKLDISNNLISNIIRKQKVHTVIHCAAYSYVMDGECNKKKYIKNNVVNTKKFLNICKNNNIKNFIFLSSSNIYDETNLNISEKSKKLPVNIYGKNKLDIENYLKKIKFENYTILRLFNIVGLIKKFYVFRFYKKNYQRLFFKIIDKTMSFKLRYFMVNKKKIYPKRDFVDINDLIKLIILIINKSKKEKIKKTFNVGSSKATSIKKIFDLFNKRDDKIISLKPEIINNKELKSTKANITYAKRYFKWAPSIKISSSIKSTLNFSILR